MTVGIHKILWWCAERRDALQTVVLMCIHLAVASDPYGWMMSTAMEVRHRSKTVRRQDHHSEVTTAVTMKMLGCVAMALTHRQ